jgi:hypothetical protein
VRLRLSPISNSQQILDYVAGSADDTLRARRWVRKATRGEAVTRRVEPSAARWPPDRDAHATSIDFPPPHVPGRLFRYVLDGMLRLPRNGNRCAVGEDGRYEGED